MLRSIKGLKDLLPSQTPSWHYMEAKARFWASRYGFSEIRTPIFESTELFSRSIGGATDIVEKEMYTFPDRDGSSLTLRPEGTAGVVRAVLEHQLLGSIITRKLFYIGPMFRHERPQAGRYRQFHQFGVEAFGIEDPGIDVEVISLLWRFFNDLGLKNLTIHMNSIGTRQDRDIYILELKKFLSPILSTLCGNCQRRFNTNPLRILDCKVPLCVENTQQAPSIIDLLSVHSGTHFQYVLTGLKDLSIPFIINPRLVRGLDYYSRTTFEITSPHLGAQSTIGAGGRYDSLVELLQGPPTPAVGFAVGLERVSLLLPEGASQVISPLVFLAGFGNQGKPAAFKILHALRQEGICAETDHKATNLKGLLRSADKLSAKISIIIGDDEAQSGIALIRNMETKEQESIPFEKILNKITHFPQ
ncbi:MAG: histidine--tRNA ligase [Nitrospirales bacterium]